MAHIFFEWNALFPAYLHCRHNHAGMDLKRFCTAKDPPFEQSQEIPVRLRPPDYGWFASLSPGLDFGENGCLRLLMRIVCRAVAWTSQPMLQEQKILLPGRYYFLP